MPPNTYGLQLTAKPRSWKFRKLYSATALPSNIEVRERHILDLLERIFAMFVIGADHSSRNFGPKRQCLIGLNLKKKLPPGLKKRPEKIGEISPFVVKSPESGSKLNFLSANLYQTLTKK
jgi:hypothetical protein